MSKAPSSSAGFPGTGVTIFGNTLTSYTTAVRTGVWVLASVGG